MGALLYLWICCYAGFRKSVVMSSRNCGFVPMYLCGSTELCVSGLAGLRWRAAHRAAGGVSSLWAFIADAFAPAVLRAALASRDRPAAHPRRAGLGAPRIPPNRLRRIGMGYVPPIGGLPGWRGWLAVPFTVSRRARRHGLRVLRTLAPWRPSSNRDGCAAPRCFRSRAILP